jgi:ATP/maltotriose-dependent transcriptional regulator MalT
MARRAAAVDPLAAESFGDLLRFLRRRLQLTQRDLGLAVGYGEAQISRLEKSHRHAPDLTTLVALFVPALQLEEDAETVARLLELAAESRGESLAGREISYERRTSSHRDVDWTIEMPPPAPPGAIRRASLLARLHDHLRLEGALAVCGLPGMGKTTVASNLAREESQAGAVCWLTLRLGVNDNADAVTRYLAGFLYHHGQAEAELLLDPARDAGPISLEKALGVILNASRSLGGLLVCLDNAHLLSSDEAGLGLLQHLLAEPAIRLLLTSRVELSLSGLHHEWLDGLTAEEGQALLTTLATELDPAVVDHLVARVAGSPILIRLAASQLRNPDTDARRFVDTLASQPQIATFLTESVLGQLSPGAHQLAQLVAAFRRPVDLLDPELIDLIHDQLKLDDVADAIAELQRHHLIVYPAQASLHPLLRERLAAHLAADGRARRAVHRAAAAWHDQQGRDPLEAGYHAVQAGEWGRVAETLAEQAERLHHAGQATSAAELLGQALARVSPEAEPDLVRRLLVGRGDLLTNSERAEQADADYRQALTLTDNAAVRAHIIARLGVALVYRGHAQEALQWVETADAALTPADTLLIGKLASVRCTALMALGRYDEAAAAGERALQQADQIAALAPHEADAIRAPTHNSLGAITHMRGQADEAVRQWNAATAAARRAGLERLACRAMFNIGNVYLVRGDLARALEQYELALAGLARTDDRYVTSRVLAGIGTVHYLRAELDEAYQAQARAAALKLTIRDAVGAAHSQGQQARILLALGRVAEARAMIEQALGNTADLGQTRSRIGLFVILAEVQQCAGDAPAALATLGGLKEFPGLADERMLWFDWQTHLAVAHLACGDLDAARALVADTAVDAVGGDVAAERHLARALLALNTGDAAAAQRETNALQATARAAGNHLLAQRAARLSPDPRDFWGSVGG